MIIYLKASSKTLDMERYQYDLENQIILEKQFHVEKFDKSITTNLKKIAMNIKRDWLNFNIDILDDICVFECELLLFIDDEKRDDLRNQIRDAYLSYIKDISSVNGILEIIDNRGRILERIDDGYFVDIQAEGRISIPIENMLKAFIDKGISVEIINESHSESHCGASGGSGQLFMFLKGVIESGITYDLIKMIILNNIPYASDRLKVLLVPTSKDQFSKLVKNISNMKKIKSHDLIMKTFFKDENGIEITFVHKNEVIRATCDLEYKVRTLITEEPRH